MLESVKNLIDKIGKGKTEAEYSDEEISEAIATLFKQMVMADGVVREAEIASAISHLVGGYSYLDKDDSAGNLAQKYSEAQSETMFTVAAVLNRALTPGQRAKLTSQLLKIAKSDNEFHPHERDYMEMINKLLK